MATLRNKNITYKRAKHIFIDFCYFVCIFDVSYTLFNTSFLYTSLSIPFLTSIPYALHAKPYTLNLQNSKKIFVILYVERNPL